MVIWEKVTIGGKLFSKLLESDSVSSNCKPLIKITYKNPQPSIVAPALLHKHHDTTSLHAAMVWNVYLQSKNLWNGNVCDWDIHTPTLSASWTNTGCKNCFAALDPADDR